MVGMAEVQVSYVSTWLMTYFSGVSFTDCTASILAFIVTIFVMGSFKNTILPVSAAHRTISGVSTLHACMYQHASH